LDNGVTVRLTLYFNRTFAYDICFYGIYFYAEVGKVTFKINGDEALSDESVLKSNGDKAFHDDFS
jgi:hypothetical protein